MEKMLRECYKEAGLLGANSITYENRRITIQRLLNDSEINEEVYDSIANWLIGNKDENKDEHIIFLEKNFCVEDKEFSIKDEKEMQVLCMVLLLFYCKENDNIINALKILCGNEIGKKLPCISVYYEFQKLVDDFRIEYRKINDKECKIKTTGVKQLKNLISESRKDLDESEYKYTTEELDKLLNIIELQEQNIKVLEKVNNTLRNQIICQREESDILWWMVNGWSIFYKKTLRNLTVEEMAIDIPIELNESSEYDLLPYPSDRIIVSLLDGYKDKTEKNTLTHYMESINDSIIELFDIEEEDIEVVQPILGAIYCMKNCGTEESAWKAMLNKKYGNNADDIIMSPIDFAKHFCLELELMNILK